MLRTYLTTLLLLFIGVLSSSAQEKSDQYIGARSDSAWEYLSMGINLERAVEIADELFEIAENQGSFKAEVNAMQIMGEYYFYRPSGDSAFIWYSQAYDLAEKEGNLREMAHSAMSLGTLRSHNGEDYNEALDYFNFTIESFKELKDTSNIIFALSKRAWLNNMADRHKLSMQDYHETIRFCRESKDSTDWGYALNGIGVILKKQENYEEAIEILEEAMAISEARDDQWGYSAAEGNLALVYKSIGRYDEAYQIFLDQLPLYEGVDYLGGILSCTANMTVTSNLMGEYERAIEEANKAIPLSREIGQPLTEADMHNEVAKAQLSLGQLNEALQSAMRSKEMADEGFFLEKQKDAEKTLSDIYLKLDRPTEALQHFTAYTAKKDSIFEKDKSNAVLELQTMYETAKKEQTINELEAEKEIERFRNKALLIGLIVVVIAALIIINREVKRRKQAREVHRLEMETERLEKERLTDQLEFKNRELTAQALHIAQKNEMLKEIKEELESSRTDSDNGTQVRSLVQKINFDKQFDKNWEQFIMAFKESNPDFLKELDRKFPELTPNEVRLAALIKMNLGNKDIAHILNISDDGVKKARYRLRKKLNMDSGDSLEALIREIGSVPQVRLHA